MKNQNQAAEKLKAYIQGLPMPAYVTYKENVLAWCPYISKQEFNQWSSGRGGIPEPAQNELEKIAGVKIFDN